MGHERGELSGSPRPASPPFLPVLYFCCHFVIWLPSVALKGVAGGVLFIRSSLLISPSPSCLVHPPSDSSALIIHTRPVLRGSGSASTANSSIAKACPNCLLFIGGLQDLERAHEGLVDAHHGAGVIKFTAIVRSGEKCDELSIAEKLVAILDDLMSSTYKVDLVLVVEFSNNILTEGEADTSIIIAPICHFFIGVRPEKIAEKACVGHVRRPHDVVDGQDFVEFGRETTVHAKDLVVN